MNNQVTRIGLVVPPGNVAMERELPNYIPANVAISTNRLSRPTAEVTPESLLAMNASLDRAANDLSMCYPAPGVILYGCTSGGFILGPEKEKQWANDVSEACGIKVVTTTSTVVDALCSLSASKVFLVTPYIDAVNAHVISYLEASGVSIAGYDSFRVPDTRDVAKIPSEEVRALVLKHRREIAGCDAVLISCTNLLTMDQIDMLETDLDVPVLTSNQCSLWGALRAVGAMAGNNSPGQLFKEMRQHDSISSVA